MSVPVSVNDYEGAIYTVILIVVYLMLLGISVVFFQFHIPMVLAIHQIALVAFSIILGIFVVRRFRKGIFSFVSVITRTNLVPVVSAAAATAAAASSATEEILPTDPSAAAAAFGLEVFGGDPNF